jgi:hypothetical protein
MSAMNRPGVVMITGASAPSPARVPTSVYWRGAGLEGALRDVEELGGKGLIVQADVADADQVERAAAAVEAAFGPIDVWVNDAFCSVFSPVNQLTPADYKRVTEGLWADQHRDWIVPAGGQCDGMTNGTGKFWRGSLLGLGLATLGTLAFGKVAGRAPRLPERPPTSTESARRPSREAAHAG